MLSARNILHPATGEPSIGASQDMVLGCYYLTMDRPDRLQLRIAEFREQHPDLAKLDDAAIRARVVRRFASPTEAMLAYNMGQIQLHDAIQVRLDSDEVFNEPGKPEPIEPSTRVETTVGRTIFNDILPRKLRFKNYAMKKDFLRQVMAECFKHYGREATATLADDIKRVGFTFATKVGASIAMSDVMVPTQRQEILDEADVRVTQLEEDFREARAGSARPVRRDLYHRELGCDQGEVPADPPALWHARPDGRSVGAHHGDSGARQLPRRPDRDGVFHLQPRRPQGTG